MHSHLWWGAPNTPLPIGLPGRPNNCLLTPDLDRGPASPTYCGALDKSFNLSEAVSSCTKYTLSLSQLLHSALVESKGSSFPPRMGEKNETSM